MLTLVGTFPPNDWANPCAYAAFNCAWVFPNMFACWVDVVVGGWFSPGPLTAEPVDYNGWFISVPLDKVKA